MASGDVFAIKMEFTFAGQECRPGFYLVEGSGTGDTDPVRGVAVNVAQKMIAGGTLGGFSEQTTLHHVTAQDIQPATGRTYRDPFTPVRAGDIADDNPVAPQDSMLIEWTTALKGGKGKFARRSRSYIPGIYGTGQIGGFLIPDLQDALSAFASIIFDAYVTDATEYQLHAVAFNPGTNPRTIREINPIVAFAVDNVVAVQRSRRPGKGI